MKTVDETILDENILNNPKADEDININQEADEVDELLKKDSKDEIHEDEDNNDNENDKNLDEKKDDIKNKNIRRTDGSGGGRNNIKISPQTTYKGPRGPINSSSFPSSSSSSRGRQNVPRDKNQNDDAEERDDEYLHYDKYGNAFI